MCLSSGAIIRLVTTALTMMLRLVKSTYVYVASISRFDIAFEAIVSSRICVACSANPRCFKRTESNDWLLLQTTLDPDCCAVTFGKVFTVAFVMKRLNRSVLKWVGKPCNAKYLVMFPSKARVVLHSMLYEIACFTKWLGSITCSRKQACLGLSQLSFSLGLCWRWCIPPCSLVSLFFMFVMLAIEVEVLHTAYMWHLHEFGLLSMAFFWFWWQVASCVEAVGLWDKFSNSLVLLRTFF